MAQFLRQRWFLIALAIVLLVGYTQAIHLEPVARQSWLRRGIVATVMFLMSLPMGMGTMVKALRNPAPALLASVLNFGLAPLVAWMFSLMLTGDMAVGMLVAGATPCTLASAAVWTRRAGGNDAVALLVTLITNLSCFVVTPLWLYATTGHQIQGEQVDPWQMVLKLLLLVVTPILLAQMLRLYGPMGDWATRHKLGLGVMAQIGVLSMISLGIIGAGLETKSQIAALLNWNKLAMVVAVMTMHLGLLALGFRLAMFLRMKREDSIAVGISGSQKTLMVGLQVAVEEFPNTLALLPIVVYHVGQLLADTVIADRWRQNGEQAESTSSDL